MDGGGREAGREGGSEAERKGTKGWLVVILRSCWYANFDIFHKG